MLVFSVDGGAWLLLPGGREDRALVKSVEKLNFIARRGGKENL